VACALDFDLQNSLNMGVIFFGKRASTAQIGMTSNQISPIVDKNLIPSGLVLRSI